VTIIAPASSGVARSPGSRCTARATSAQVTLEVRGDSVTAGFVQGEIGVAALLQRPHIAGDLVILVGHLTDRRLPLLGLLGKRAQRHLKVEYLARVALGEGGAET
jgi:hypothetical protein